MDNPPNEQNKQSDEMPEFFLEKKEKLEKILKKKLENLLKKKL